MLGGLSPISNCKYIKKFSVEINSWNAYTNSITAFENGIMIAGDIYANINKNILVFYSNKTAIIHNGEGRVGPSEIVNTTLSGSTLTFSTNSVTAVVSGIILGF